jgi:glutamyl-tRNA(Gln) amidotransferase subunit D
MYADAIQDRLDENDIAIGDRVKITTGSTTYTGILMPRSEQGDSSTLVIKLDNGYNLGVSYDDNTTIELGESVDRTEERPTAEQDHDPEKPDIAILHTGGTIASRVSYDEGGVKPAFDPEELLEIYPELGEQANIESTVIAQMFSEDMEPGHWVRIAEAVADHRDADGIIIGHGTDTMHFSAAALSFMLRNIDIPVVFVGSQRSSDRPSSDAAMNLLSAVQFIQEDVPGVYVCMHDAMSDDTTAIHLGTRVRKMHTSRRDAFRSIDTQPVARVNHETGKVTYTDKSLLVDTENEFELCTAIDEQVGLLKTRPGLDPERIDFYRENDYNGLVVEGTGLGHLPVNAFDDETAHHDDVLDAVQEFTEDGVVAMSSQCLHGRVNMNVYDSGVKLQDTGVISAETMIPEVAYVKLMWVLGQTETVDEAKDLFATNIAGEIVDREEYDAY